MAGGAKKLELGQGSLVAGWHLRERLRVMDVEPCVEERRAVDGGGFEMAILARELAGGSKDGGLFLPGEACRAFAA